MSLVKMFFSSKMLIVLREKAWHFRFYIKLSVAILERYVLFLEKINRDLVLADLLSPV